VFNKERMKLRIKSVVKINLLNSSLSFAHFKFKVLLIDYCSPPLMLYRCEASTAVVNGDIFYN